jgi:hypothetical protein
MGACGFCEHIEGYNAGECFDRLVSDAISEYGNDPYNGTISTCSMGRVKTISKKYSNAVNEKAMKMIQDEDYGRKWVASVLDLGVVGYDIISITKKAPTTKTKAKYVQKYAVIRDEERGEKVIASFDSKTEADEKAIKLTMDNPLKTYFVAKRPVNINNGDDTVTNIIVKRERREKPLKPNKNRIVKEVHKYIFYGLAAC